MTTTNTLYVDSLIDFILDTKPFHSKMSEIVEEYQFCDKMFVEITEQPHFIRTELSSAWNYPYISNGIQTKFRIPTFLTPRVTSNVHQHIFTGVASETAEITNLAGVFRTRAHDGVKEVRVNAFPKIEAIDYHVSQGIFSANITGQKWIQSNITSIKSPSIPGSPYTYLHPLNIVDLATPTEVWHLVALTPTTFSVIGDVSGPTANATVDVPYTNGQLSFTINTWFQPFVGGEEILVGIVNDPASITNLDLSDGYDIFPFDREDYVGIDGSYDTRFSGYNIAGINLAIVNLGITPGVWAIRAINATTFSVQTVNPATGTIVQSYAPATVSVPYNNGEVSFEIQPPPGPFLPGDTFTFEVLNAPPYIVDDNAFPTIPALSYPQNDGSLFYEEIHETNGEVVDITANSSAVNYEEWTLECVASPVGTTTDFLKHTQTVASTNWTITHNFDSTDVFYQVYIEIAPGNFMPSNPSMFTFVDSNTISLNFSVARTGFVVLAKYISIPGLEYKHVQSTPLTTWVIPHALNSQNLLFQAYEWYLGDLRPVLPSNVTFADDDNLIVQFSVPTSGVFLVSKDTDVNLLTFNQAVPATNWIIPNTLDTAELIFSVYVDVLGVFTPILPASLSASASQITVSFSVPFAGKIVLAKRLGSYADLAVYSVTGSSSGFIGSANPNIPFTSSSINFTILPGVAGPQIGDTFVLTPYHQLTIHQSAPVEKWSLIKVNPLAYTRPKLTSTQLGDIDPVSVINAATPTQTWTVTALNATNFSVVGSVSGPTPDTAVNTPYSNGEITFTINAGTRPFTAGDYFEIEVVNEISSILNLGITDGYDLEPYDDTNTFYDARFNDYNVGDLNLTIVDQGYTSSYWELRAIDATTFSVQTVNQLTGLVVQSFANATVGSPYNNGVISFTIVPASSAFNVNDKFTFTLNNPPPYVSNDPTILTSATIAYLRLYAKSYLNSPSQTWTITAISPSSFNVTGSVSGLQAAQATPDVSYDNGNVHFTIESNSMTFVAGDTFTFDVLANKPTYLVHGTTSGMQDPAEVGKWYWNGKIGFKLPEPKYQVQNYTIGSPNKDISELLSGTVIVDSNNRTLTFNRQPRLDAVTERYRLDFITQTSGAPIFNVQRSIAGTTVAAHNNVRFTDENVDRTLTHNSNLNPGTNFDLRDGVVDFTISDNGSPFSGSFTHDFTVKAHDFDLYYGHDLVIFNDRPAVSSEVIIDQGMFDKFYLNIDQVSSMHPEIKPSASNWLPIYMVGNSVFTDPATVDSAYLSTLTNYKIGSVDTLLDPATSRSYYVFDFDPTFLTDYLPVNTQFTFRIEQQESHAATAKTIITDEIKFADAVAFREDLTISISEKFDIFGQLAYTTLGDAMNVTITDGPFTGFWTGYDSLPYDDEENPTGNYDALFITQNAFGASAGGLGVQTTILTTDPLFQGFESGYDELPYDAENPSGNYDAGLPVGRDGITLAPAINDDAFVLYSISQGQLGTESQAVVTLGAKAIPTSDNPFFGGPLGSTPLSYVTLTNPVAEVIITHNFQETVTVLVVDDPINLNPLPFTGPTVINLRSFKITLPASATFTLIVT